MRILPDLKAILGQTPKDNVTFLLTEFGKPLSSAGFGHWMCNRCDEAGLRDCASHGLRKACARRFAKAGCSNLEATTGRETKVEVTRTSKAADQKIMARHALGKLPDILSGKKNTNELPKVTTSKD